MPSPHDLSIRQLEYIVAVADTLGFHRAAERCHASQPTLSAQIRQAESVLGLPIFERSRRGVIVTEAGAAIVARARRVLAEVGDLLAEATRAKDPFAGTFRIGVIPTVAPYLLPDVMPAVARAYPELRLVLREAKTDEIVHALAEGSLDAGLLALEADIGDLAHAAIAIDPFVVALPKEHPLAKKKRLHGSDLDGAPVLLLDDTHCFRAQAIAACGTQARDIDFRGTSLTTVAQMVASGAGVTLLPELAVPLENRQGELEIRAFAPPVPHRTLALAWRPTSPFAAAFGALAAVLRNVLQKPRRPRARSRVSVR